MKIRSISKSWPITIKTVNCFFWLLQNELVVVGQRKNKRILWMVL
jgi:hypothetical protein